MLAKSQSLADLTNSSKAFDFSHLLRSTELALRHFKQKITEAIKNRQVCFGVSLIKN